MTTAIRAPNILLLGGSGSGKTYSLRTLIDAGITPFIIFTEPGFEVLDDLPKDKCHWHYIPPAKVDWTVLEDSAKKINTMSYEMLAKLSDVNKSKYGQFIEVLRALSNFTCDRTGEKFGDVSEWSADRAIVVDSLSGLNIMAMDLVVGSKPTKSMSDWMVAMDNLERLLNKLATDTNAVFVLLAHLERETDEVSGGVQLMASTLGRKLAPKLPRFFSDVIHVKRDAANFHWSTASLNVDSKARNVPISDKLPPSFKPLIDTWKNRQAANTNGEAVTDSDIDTKEKTATISFTIPLPPRT